MTSFLSLLCLSIMAAIAVVAVSGETSSLVEALSRDVSGEALHRNKRYAFLSRAIFQEVDRLAKRGCESGSASYDICDPDAGFLDTCIFEFVITGGLTVVNVPVAFSPPFEQPPAVYTGLSGFFFSEDKNCTASASAVTETGFNLTLTLGGVFPFKVQAAWMACDPSMA